MKTITLGRTGLAVSRIAFGTWQLGGDWGEFDEHAAVAAIRRARELGVNFFDTAQAYGFGASEAILGKALRDELSRDRDELVIATKAACAKPIPAWSATQARSGYAEEWTRASPRWVSTTSTCTRFTGPTPSCRPPRRRAPWLT